MMKKSRWDLLKNDPLLCCGIPPSIIPEPPNKFGRICHYIILCNTCNKPMPRLEFSSRQYAIKKWNAHIVTNSNVQGDEE